MRRIWLLALAAALLTTACRIETNVLINLNADETGTFGFEFGMDDEFRQLVSAQGEGFDVDDLFGGVTDEFPGATVSERTEGDMMFSVFTFAFDDPAQFRQLMAQGGDEGGDIDITWEDDRVTIDAVLEGTGESGGLGGFGLGDLGDAADDLGGDFDISGLSGFAESFFSGSVIVAMPGEVLEHNANRVLGDGRLQWDLLVDGGDLDIHAVSTLSDGSSFPAWALLLIVLVAAAVLAWLFATMRKRRSLAALEAAGVEGAEAATPPSDWSTAPSPHATDWSKPPAEDES